jgi:hypothetical protein
MGALFAFRLVAKLAYLKPGSAGDGSTFQVADIERNVNNVSNTACFSL